MAVAALEARAWSASVAVHVAIVALFATLLGRGHRHHHEDETSPARLVWVEPAAPLVGSPGAPQANVAPAPMPVVPEPRVEPPVLPKPVAPVAVPPAAPLTRRRAREPRPAVSRQAPRPAAAARTSDRGIPADVPASQPGETAGLITGSRVGTAGAVGDAAVPLGSVATPPELLARVMPDYPSRARDLEVEGQVLLEVVVDREGKPERELKVLRSIALLDAAAIAAVRQWRFRPARDADGNPVRVIMEIPVRFELR
jgi:periplasmic protein TonB